MFERFLTLSLVCCELFAKNDPHARVSQNVRRYLRRKILLYLPYCPYFPFSPYLAVSYPHKTEFSPKVPTLVHSVVAFTQLATPAHRQRLVLRTLFIARNSGQDIYAPGQVNN
jgi:hypothetical protein